MIQVRSYWMALEAVEEYVGSARSNLDHALLVARDVEKSATADRDRISDLIHYLSAAIEALEQ